MNTIGLPGYRVHEYKLVVAPHEELAKKIMAIQKEFNEGYGVESGVHVPQLLLASFKQLQAVESRVINRLKLISMGFHPIKIELKNFGSYPSHTVFIQVESKAQVTELVKKIREDAGRLMKLDADNKPFFTTEPVITIARKLKPWQYEQGWLEYGTKHFSGKFIAQTMILLRKKEDEYRFSPIESFSFQNLPIEIKQGDLF